MFKRFLLLLLIALLPLQGVAASFAVKCQAMQSGEVPCHEAAPIVAEMPCHDHEDGSTSTDRLADQGCCHHLAVAIPQVYSSPGAELARGLAYPAPVTAFSDHLADRLQRPPLKITL